MPCLGKVLGGRMDSFWVAGLIFHQLLAFLPPDPAVPTPDPISGPWSLCALGAVNAVVLWRTQATLQGPHPSQPKGPRLLC